MSWVPVVDISKANAPALIDEACERAGFITIVGHGVADSVVADAWNNARAFFDLPLADRMLVAMPRFGYPYGYSPMAGETLTRSLGQMAAPDLKESFAIGPVDRPTHTIADPDESFAWSENIWPAALPTLQPACGKYFRAMSDLAARLLRLMATGLDLPETHFDLMIDRHTSAMRALNYPAVERSEGRLGAVAAAPGAAGVR